MSATAVRTNADSQPSVLSLCYTFFIGQALCTSAQRAVFAQARETSGVFPARVCVKGGRQPVIAFGDFEKNLSGLRN